MYIYIYIHTYIRVYTHIYIYIYIYIYVTLLGCPSSALSRPTRGRGVPPVPIAHNINNNNNNNNHHDANNNKKKKKKKKHNNDNDNTNHITRSNNANHSNNHNNDHNNNNNPPVAHLPGHGGWGASGCPHPLWQARPGPTRHRLGITGARQRGHGVSPTLSTEKGPALVRFSEHRLLLCCAQRCNAPNPGKASVAPF